MASLASGAPAATPALAGPDLAKATARKTAVLKQLDQQTLEQRLTLGWPGLINELYQFAQRQLQFETGRQTRLDAKATSLLSAAGLSLTVAFTFGGLLLANKEVLRANIGWYYSAVAGFGLAIILGLGAAGFALAALKVRDANRGISEDAVFNEELLKRAEDESADEQAVAEYRKSLTVHLWTIAQAQHMLHERKAKIIQRGQVAFMAFMCAVALVCVTFVGGILLSNVRPQAEPVITHEASPDPRASAVKSVGSGQAAP
ncbi:hypothetical protein WMF01_30925 [Sorangium sp. So ce1667]